MPAGRPPKWTNPEEVQRLGEEFFAKQEALGKPITITGLAYHLETTRQILCNYEEKDEFRDTISRLKMRAERYAEERLYEGAATGPIFALKNFGWRDNQEIDLGNKGGKPFETKNVSATDEEIILAYMDMKNKKGETK